MRYVFLVALAFVAMPSFAQQPASGLLADAKGKCKAANLSSVADVTMSWSGVCRDGLAEGNGVELILHGDKELVRFKGEMRKGRPDGRGTIVYADGNSYEGEFIDGRFQGRGTAKGANGDRYEGEFLAGKFDGRGNFLYANGNRYEGGFKAGLFEGRGTYQAANGDRYDGEFAKGRPNGFGSFMAPSGVSFTGAWKNGCYKEGSRVAWLTNSKEGCGF